MYPRMNEGKASPKAIVAEGGKEGNTIAGKKSRLKALMHRDSQEEEEKFEKTIESSASAVAKVDGSNKEATVKKKRATSKSKLSTSRQQQLLIHALQSENSDLRSTLEASLQENCQLKEMMRHQQEVAMTRNRNLQGMVQKFNMHQLRRQQQQQQQPPQDEHGTTRLLPNLAKLANRGSSRPAVTERGQESRRSGNDTLQAQQQRLAMAMQSTATARVATAPIQYSHDNATATPASQAESVRALETVHQQNVSEQAKIAARLSELQSLQEELQVLTDKLARR